MNGELQVTSANGNAAELTEEEKQKAQEMVALFTASFMKNLQLAPSELIDEFGNLHYEKTAARLLDTAKENLELARFFADRSASTGSPGYKAFCEKWVEVFQGKVSFYQNEALSAHVKIETFVDELNGKIDANVGFFGEGATGRRILPALDRALTVLDLTTAIKTQDWGKVGGIAVGFFVGEAVASLAAIVLAGTTLPAVAMVLLVAVIGGAAGIAAGEVAESAFDGIFGTPEDEPIATRVARVLSDGGATRLPDLGYTLRYGSANSDSISGVGSENDSIVASGGDDIVYGGLGDDYVSGGSGQDTLYGEAGEDTLLGGIGNDVLIGGAGGDSLSGGEGFDTYQFTTADLGSSQVQDVIEDSDGLGRITFNNLDISGTGIGFRSIRHASLGSWETHDGSFRLAVIGAGTATQSLLIIRQLPGGGVGGRILVRNWQNGGLGITLPDFHNIPPVNGLVLGGEDDLFGAYGSNVGNDTVNGGAGNDGLSGGTGDDVLDGGAGDDLIFGFSGDDRLFGGDGNDYIFDGSESVQMRSWSNVYYVEGTDRTERQYHEDEITRLGASIIMRGSAWYGYRNANGSSSFVVDSNFSLDPNQYASGDDLLDGGAGNDVLRAGEGNDILIGGTGNDVLDGGHDNDTLSGGDGDDRLYGDASETAIPGVHFTARVSSAARQDGNDIIDAGAGNDFVAGGGGNDVIHGGLGNDTLLGRGQDRTVDGDDADSDYIDGGDGDDLISGDDGNDTLLGGAGADTIRGDQERADTRSGNDIIDGGAGNDQLFGDGGDDEVEGGDGDDTVVGDSLELDGSRHGNDVLSGGAGNDMVIGLGGNDVVRGGDGHDHLQGDGAVAAEFHGNDQIYGGAGNDQLFGGGGNDVLDGGADDDLLFGDAGDDRLTGGDGADELSGGDGNDTLSGGNGTDLLFGEAGDDTLAGGEGDDILSGGEGADVLSGGGGADDLVGDEGNDTLDGGSGNDRLWGHAGNDRVEGGAGNDYIDGDDNIATALHGNDELFGGSGNDVIFGRGGNDLLDGGIGDDELTGGAGDDVYVFSTGWGRDRIFGLGAADAGADVIRFGVGIAAADLIFGLNAAGSLTISTLDGENTLEVGGFFETWESSHRIEFADGTVLNADAIAALISPSSAYYGGTGDDTIVGGSSGDTINGGIGNDILHGGSGHDVIYGGRYSGSLAAGTDDDVLFGGAGGDVLDGQEGNDWLEGGQGFDNLFGGLGSDVLIGGEGGDTLRGDASHLENPFFAEAGGDDILDGGAGNDTLVGGLGTNRYRFAVGFGQDTLFLTEPAAGVPPGLSGERAILEFAEGITASALVLTMVGNDLVISSGTDRITVRNYGQRSAASLELSFADGSILSQAQLSVLNPTRFGSEGSDQIIGSSLRDIIYGQGGDDLLRGGAGNDYLDGGSGNDVIRGNDLDWSAPVDNDTIRGGRGDDELYGDSGNDIYLYDVGDGTDSIYEFTNVTTVDTLRLGVGITPSSVTLARDGSALILITANLSDQIRLEGFFDGVATGNFGVDRVEFADGTVWLASTMAETVVYGTQNSMAGGAGDDTHVIDHHLDSVSESANAGIDTVLSSVSYTAEANIENVTLTGSAAIDATGNSLANTLRGNAANNTLSGGSGNDTAYGGEGDDTYYGVENIIEEANGGYDTHIYSGSADGYTSTLTLASNVERLVVSGAYNGQSFRGNELDNVIVVQSANSNISISGGAGADFIDLSALDLATMVNIWIHVDHVGDQFALNAEGPNASHLSRVNITVTSNLSGSYHWQDVVDHYINSSTGVVDIRGNDAANVITISSAASGSVAAGGNGDDRYILSNANVEIFEDVDGGVDTIEWAGAYNSTITLAENVERLVISASSVNSSGIGNALDNTITGNESNNSLSGAAGSDVLFGWGGNDTLDGGDGNDSLDGGTGDDVLTGGAGEDVMTGGAGNDSYYVDSAGDVVIEEALASSGYHDRVFASVDYTLTENVEHLTLIGGAVMGQGNSGSNTIIGNEAGNHLIGGSGFDWLEGHAGNDHLDGGNDRDWLYGGEGSDLLDGGAGDDQLTGGLGSDTYFYRVGDGNDTIEEAVVDEGVDVLRLAEGISAADVTIRRSGRTNALWIEIGGAVITLQGEGLEEVHFHDGTVWQVAEHVEVSNDAPLALGFGEGLMVRGQPFQFSVAQGFQDEDALTFDTSDLPSWMSLDRNTGIITGTVPIDAVDLNLTITATDTAGQSVSTVLALPAISPIQGTASADSLVGTAQRDVIFGFAGNDTLNGGAGSDLLYGGAGDDTYVVDVDSDVVIELADEGNDLVNASVSYRLGDHVERLTLTGTSGIAGYGNSLANTLTGNSGANELYGYEGNDTLAGNNGNDVLDGGAGDDFLDGGSGSDVMRGGLGNDTFVVGATGDVVAELQGEGVDTVRSSISYTLGEHLENLTLTGSSGLSGSGNELDNVITGNSGANTLRGFAGNDTLNGGAGNDTMIGGIGDDTYIVNATGDVVTELANEGVDTVQSSVSYTLGANVENLTLTGTSGLSGTGNTLDNVLIGTTGNNALSGLAGNDTLDGRAGTDTLTGGTGSDTYLFARGYGSDTVVENDGTAGTTDVARFLAGVAYDQLWFSRPSGTNNLEIAIIGTTDKLVIRDWYLGAQYRVEEIRTADGGYVLTAANVQALVTQMATMTRPTGTTLTSSQRTQLSSTFAATWTQQSQSGQASAALSQPAAELVPSEFDHGIREIAPSLAYVAPVSSSILPFGVPAFDVIGQDDPREERWEFTMGEGGNHDGDPTRLWGCTIEPTAEANRELQVLVDAIAMHGCTFGPGAADVDSGHELGVIRPERLLAPGLGAGPSRESIGHDLIRLH